MSPAETFVSNVKKSIAYAGHEHLDDATMDSMKATEDALVEDGARKSIKMIIGGAPTSMDLQRKNGADMYAGTPRTRSPK